MRVSRFLRHRAQMNRTRYAVRLLVSEVLPSLTGSMGRMHDIQRLQNDRMTKWLDAAPAVPATPEGGRDE